MSIVEGLKETISGRKAAREKLKQLNSSNPITSQEAFLMFSKLWEFHFGSKNYQDYMNSDLADARRERTLKTAKLHAKLNTLPFFKDLK